jgi:hypothetical protein
MGDKNWRRRRAEEDMACGMLAAGLDMILRLDSGLNNVNWSDFEVNRNDSVGDNIARQLQCGILLMTRILPEYR